MLDRNQFIKTISGLCELYNKVPSQFIFDVYYEIFKEFDLVAFNRAVKECIKSNKYNVLPKPAEILEFLEGNKDDKALNAWLLAKEGVKKCGYYHSPIFEDPIISHCLTELGGWENFCSVKLDELPFVEKRFLDLYRLFLKRGVSSSVKLSGFIENRNNNNNYKVPDPVKIGSQGSKNLRSICTKK